MKTEPVAIGALVLAIVSAALALLPTFGVTVTAEQSIAITTLAGAIVAFWQRSKVTPVAKLGAGK